MKNEITSSCTGGGGRGRVRPVHASMNWRGKGRCGGDALVLRTRSSANREVSVCEVCVGGALQRAGHTAEARPGWQGEECHWQGGAGRGGGDGTDVVFDMKLAAESNCDDRMMT